MGCGGLQTFKALQMSFPNNLLFRVGGVIMTNDAPGLFCLLAGPGARRRSLIPDRYDASNGRQMRRDAEQGRLFVCFG